MRLLRIVIPVTVALLVTAVSVYLSERPHPSECGGGGFSMSNEFGNSSSSFSNASFTTFEFVPGGTVSYAWSVVSGGGAGLYLQSPDGQRTSLAASGGSDSLVAETGTYTFGMSATPAETVSVTYSEVCLR